MKTFGNSNNGSAVSFTSQARLMKLMVHLPGALRPRKLVTTWRPSAQTQTMGQKRYALRRLQLQRHPQPTFSSCRPCQIKCGQILFCKAIASHPLMATCLQQLPNRVRHSRLLIPLRGFGKTPLMGLGSCLQALVAPRPARAKRSWQMGAKREMRAIREAVEDLKMTAAMSAITR